MTAPASRTITPPAGPTGGGSSFSQGASEVLDYGIDWTTWLGTDTISSSAWTVPTGLTKGTTSNTTTRADCFLSAGAAGQSYLVTNTITTAASRTATRSFYVAFVTNELA